VRKFGTKKTDCSTMRLFLFFYVVVGALLACQQNNDASANGTFMKVKVVSLEQCGATQPTIALVKEVAREAGVDISLEHIIVKTLEEAQAHRHIGSPTVQINGLDIEPEVRQIQQFGLT